MKTIGPGIVKFVAVSVCATIVFFKGDSVAQDAPGPPASKEFREKYTDSQEGRPLVEEALSIANTLLGSGNQFILQATWAPAVVKGKTIIPVYLGMPRGDESHAIAFVPDQEKSIIVEAGELSLLEEIMGNNGKHAVKQPPAVCLAIVLLHETGHIALKHGGRMDGSADKFVITPRVQKEAELDIKSRLVDARLAMKEANFKNVEKKREFAADKFVCEQIKAAGNDNANISRWVKAKTAGTALTMICFNLGTARMLEAFNPDILLSVDRNTQYWDKDKEHPNLEYRMLLINYFLAVGTEAESSAKNLAEDFVARQGMIENGLILPRINVSR